MKNIIVVVLICISIFGCSVFTGFKSVKESVQEVQSGNIIHEIKAANLSTVDITIVDHSFNNLNEFINKWSKINSTPNLEDFLQDYANAKSSYKLIYGIIEKNYSGYLLELQNKFSKYKKDAEHIDSSVNSMIIGRDIYNASKQAVKLAMLVVGMLK